MARLKKRGESGAAKNFITRNQGKCSLGARSKMLSMLTMLCLVFFPRLPPALKKLQVSLSDFRRLCILKGIHPQQPRHAKRANKGSSAPATFYYTKDIVYLAHEPILQSLRDHKAFAKKLSRAIGRREWAAAKNLEDAKPRYTLDHIIKQRYPSFDEALGDIDDALCTIVLFANLPAKMYNLPEGVVDTCSRLKREWDEYVVRTGALRKTFLSIKGIYFQASVRGRDITWLVPYPFTQHVPHDVDFRVMSTFLELYTTLLGFVLFKLWSDLGEAYPPKLDSEPKTASAAGENTAADDDEEAATSAAKTPSTAAASGLSKKAIRKAIRSIEQTNKADGEDETGNDGVDDVEVDAEVDADPASEFATTSTRAGIDTLPLPSTSGSSATSNLFRSCTFYLDRSTPLSLLNFTLRSYGALQTRIGWDSVLAPNSPFTADDARITHVLIDRPDLPASARQPGRRYVQPQWVVDSANRGVLLPEDKYEVGKTLPPHLSPFVDGDEAMRVAAAAEEEEEAVEDEAMSSSGGEEEEDDEDEESDSDARPALAALLASSSNPTAATDSGLLDATELEAESLGGEAAIEDVRRQWAQATRRSSKKSGKTGASAAAATEDEEAKKMARGLLSNRQRKLYDKLSYTKTKKQEEQQRLERRREEIKRDERKKEKAGGK